MNLSWSKDRSLRRGSNYQVCVEGKHEIHRLSHDLHRLHCQQTNAHWGKKKSFQSHADGYGRRCLTVCIVHPSLT